MDDSVTLEMRREGFELLDAYDSVVRVAQLVGDPSRATMLMALMDGQAWPAGDLARAAGVAPSTASDHLGQLVAGGLLTVVRQGRHRYYRIADESVAQIMKSMAAAAPPGQVRSLRQSDERSALRHARTCYDHVAGCVGVAVTEGAIARGYFEATGADHCELTDAGLAWLQELGVEWEGGRRGVPLHIDWTERVGHLAGPLAVRLTARLCELGWFTRGAGEGVVSRRAVVVTEAGKAALRDYLGIDVDGLEG